MQGVRVLLEWLSLLQILRRRKNFQLTAFSKCDSSMAVEGAPKKKWYWTSNVCASETSSFQDYKIGALLWCRLT